MKKGIAQRGNPGFSSHPIVLPIGFLACFSNQRSVHDRRLLQKRVLEGYGVDIVLIFTRRGGPNSADCPPKYPLYLTEAELRAEERRNDSVRW